MPHELQDSSTAKALAFHKEVRTRCITLEGDDFNPGGLLTGPSAYDLTPSIGHLFSVAAVCCAEPSFQNVLLSLRPDARWCSVVKSGCWSVNL